MLCDYIFELKREDYPLCWRPSNHKGEHQKFHEVKGLRREMARVMQSEKKKKRGRES